MKKRQIGYLLLILAFVIGILSYLYLNNFNMALMSAGYSDYDVNVLERGVDDNGHEFKIVKLSHYTTAVLAKMEKNKYGFWKVSYTGQKSSIENKFITIGWMKQAGFKYFNENDELITAIEWHIIYYGENAIKLIEIPYEKLPSGVAVNVQQSGKSYLIHTISYEDPEILNKIDMYSILQELECIKAYERIGEIN